MPKGHSHKSFADAQRYYVPEPVTRCWLWQGVLDDYGYGRFWLHGKEFQAHRVLYEVAHGPIPKGLVIDHICRVKHCVNPDHLEAVTQKENTLRGLRGRQITHCMRGHEFTETNTRTTADGRRVCRACCATRAKQARQHFRLLRGG